MSFGPKSRSTFPNSSWEKGKIKFRRRSQKAEGILRLFSKLDAVWYVCYSLLDNKSTYTPTVLIFMAKMVCLGFHDCFLVLLSCRHLGMWYFDFSVAPSSSPRWRRPIIFLSGEYDEKDFQKWMNFQTWINFHSGREKI